MMVNLGFSFEHSITVTSSVKFGLFVELTVSRIVISELVIVM